MMKIDAHHHFWNYNAAEYDWIDDSMQLLRRDFLPPDLLQEIEGVEIDGVISVQARQSVAETEWLLKFCDTNEFIRGVVGWVPLRESGVQGPLERLSSSSKLRAVRHVVQGEPDDQFILRKDFNQGVAQLKNSGLAYDILILERHLPATIEFVDRHPQQVFVLDHIAKPQISKNLLEPWRKNILELAKRPQVYCKVSGMVTEADFETWTPKQLAPYWDTVLEAFSPTRLMFGSDWPVCLVACDYVRWHQTVKSFIGELSAVEQNAIFGGTATSAYDLDLKKSEP